MAALWHVWCYLKIKAIKLIATYCNVIFSGNQ